MIFYDPNVTHSLTPQLIQATEEIKIWAKAQRIGSFKLNGLHITTEDTMEQPVNQADGTVVDQSRSINGYRVLTQEEIDMINEIKEAGVMLGKLCEKLDGAAFVMPRGQPSSHTNPRWVDIGRTNLQQGIMALVRSVARPETF